MRSSDVLLRADLEQLGFVGAKDEWVQDIQSASRTRLEVISWLVTEIKQVSEGGNADPSAGKGVLEGELIRYGVCAQESDARDALRPPPNSSRESSIRPLRNLLDLLTVLKQDEQPGIADELFNAVLADSALVLQTAQKRSRPNALREAKKAIMSEVQEKIELLPRRHTPQQDSESRLPSVVATTNEQLGKSLEETLTTVQNFAAATTEILSIDSSWMADSVDDRGWHTHLQQYLQTEQTLKDATQQAESILHSFQQAKLEYGDLRRDFQPFFPEGTSKGMIDVQNNNH